MKGKLSVRLGSDASILVPLYRAALCAAMGWGALLAPTHAAAQHAPPPPLRLLNDTAHRELVFELAPLDLPAHLGHEHAAEPPTGRVKLPFDGWLHGFRVEVVDGAGRAVPRQLIHHINILATEERELFSPIMLRVGAAGQETGEIRIPRLVGYRVKRGQEIAVTAMLHNPTPQGYAGVKVRVYMPYTRATSWWSPISVYPFYLDVMPLAGEKHAYDLPPGRSEKSWEARPAVAGRILGMGGHLHRYGVALRLEDVTNGSVIWEAQPEIDAKGEVVGIPNKFFLWRLGVPISPDHVYRLTAVYENPTGQTIPDGAMGALGGIILPARGALWPAVDPRDPDYLLDVRERLLGGGGPMEQMHMGHPH